MTDRDPRRDPFRRVVVDVFPESVAQYRDDHAIVAVDVIRATTMAVTAVALGRRCFVAGSLPEAMAIRDRLPDALLAGEIGGDLPDGFDMNNSPADLAERTDLERPLVMLSSSGTRVMTEAVVAPNGAYVASFRNFRAVAEHVAGRHDRVAVIGAGSRGTFREEDQMACAWIAEILAGSGYAAADERTDELIRQWSGQPATACIVSDSVAYLGRTGQIRDYDFVVGHVDDVDMACRMSGNEVEVVAVAERQR